MTQSNDREHCLERARMHESLAGSTRDTAARQVHQAMAAEFRRRADQSPAGEALHSQGRGQVSGLFAATG